MWKIFAHQLFAFALVSTLMIAVNAKILHMDIPVTSAKGPLPNAAASTLKFSPGKEKRERILGDGIFTLGYSTKFNYGHGHGGFGGYPGYYGYGHGFGNGYGYGHNHGFYPSHGLGYYGQHYDPYFSKPYHHHHHHGGYSGGFGFKHHFQQHGGFSNHYSGYPGYF